MKTLILLIFSTCFFSANSQGNYKSPEVSPFLIPKHITFQEEAKTEFQFLKELYSNVSKDNKFKLYSDEVDDLDYRHKKYHQIFKGYEVENAVLYLHIKDEVLYLVNGTVFKIEDKSTTPIVDKINAEKIAKEFFGISNIEIDTTEKAKLVWVPIDGNYYKEFRLAYKFDLYSRGPLKREYVYVDAMSGNIVWSHNRIHTSGVDGTLTTKYSGVKTCIIDSLSSTSYRLRDSTRGNGLFVYNLNRSINYQNATDFTHTSKIWSSTTTLDYAARDILWGTQHTYDYYFNNFNRASIDNNNYQLLSYYPYDTDFANAFWDGDVMTYGEGDASFGITPLTAIDVIAHEITHGVTQHTASLIYTGEYGALNESFSDIFGKAIEFDAKPTGFSWIVGHEVTSGGIGIRDMSNPNSHDDPDTYNGIFWLNNNDVHINSGVQNYWFYLLTVGKNDVNDLGNAFSVQGIGMANSQKIAYRNLAFYLFPYAEYADARTYSIQSASDIFGSCSNEIKQTTNAWYAVGVGDSFTTTFTPKFFSKDTSLCSIDDTVYFFNNTSGFSSCLWDFGDGTTSTLVNPKHKYNTYSNYTVKLKVWNCNSTIIDSITKVNYIQFDSTNIKCNPIIFPKSGNLAVTGCDMTILDDGGLTQDYSNDITSSITISSPNHSCFEVNFKKFKLTSNDIYDNLSFYNGPTDDYDNHLATYFGYDYPFPLTSDTNVMTIKFQSDDIFEDEGFEINIKCLDKVPDIDFNTESSNICADSVQFFDATKINGLIVSYLWDFGDGTQSSLKNPIHKYTTTGYYDVSLKVCNNIGCDSVKKNYFLYYNDDISYCGSEMQCGGYSAGFSCQGVLLDDGNIISNYSNNCESRYYVSNNSKFFHLKFDQFKLASGDTLYIYTNNVSGNLKEYHANNPPPIGVDIDIEFDIFYVKFVSDNSMTDSGFILRYKCYVPPPTILDFQADSITCTGTVNFRPFVQDYNVSYLWDFGDGTTSTAYAPRHTYNNIGAYTIKLIVCNSQGCDTMIKIDYVKYDTIPLFCSTIVGNSPNDICKGYFVDDGSLMNDYSNNNNTLSYLNNFFNKAYKIKFHTFKLKPGDTLYIYDNTNNELLYALSGQNLPNNGNDFIINSKSLKFWFITDGQGVDSGFVLEYSCVNPELTSDFAVDKRQSCSGVFSFLGKNLVNYCNYYWDFGDGNTFTSSFPSYYYYQYDNPGTYTISLKVCDNNNKCDSTKKVNYVVYDPQSEDCKYKILDPNNPLYINDCEGILVDDGSIDNNYSPFSYAYATFNNQVGKTYKIRFKQFKLEDDDYIEISTPTRFVEFDNTNPPTLDSIIELDGILYFTFNAFNSTTDSGFIMEYFCDVPVMDSIDTDFDYNYTTTCGEIHFIPHFQYGDNYYWDFGDGTTSTDVNSAHIYTSEGKYTVSLKICSDGTCDSIVKEDLVSIKYPVADFDIPDSIYAGNRTLTNRSSSSDSYEWQLDNTRISTTKSPRYNFKNSGYHTLKLIASYFGCSDSLEKEVYIRNDIGSISNLHGEDDIIALMPNRTNGKTTFSIISNNTKHFVGEAKVYDMVGRLVSIIPVNVINGIYEKSLDFSTFANGKYYLTLNLNSNIHNIPFEIIK